VSDILVAFVIFCLLAGAALAALLSHHRLPPQFRSDETANVVAKVAGLFVVTTSLLLGLMLNSARTTFETTDRNIHALATSLIILDRTLRRYGPEMAETRKNLKEYTEYTARKTWLSDRVLADRTAEALLDVTGESIGRVLSQNPAQTTLWQDINAQYYAIVRLRWAILEQSDGSVPAPLIAMMIAWLVLIFANFGYRAPANSMVIGTLVLSAAMIAFSIYLILNLDRPFEGLIPMVIGIDRREPISAFRLIGWWRARR
jgi:hypothetical protein